MTLRYLWGSKVTKGGPFVPTFQYKWKLLYAFLQINVNATLTTADSLTLYRSLITVPGDPITEQYVLLTSGLSVATYSSDMGVSPYSYVSDKHTQINAYPELSDGEQLALAITLASGDTFDYWILVDEVKA